MSPEYVTPRTAQNFDHKSVSKSAAQPRFRLISLGTPPCASPRFGASSPPQSQTTAEDGHDKEAKNPGPARQKPRSQLWFDNPDNPGMTALYLERYLNFGLTGRSSLRQADHRHRADRLGPVALQPPPSGTGQARARRHPRRRRHRLRIPVPSDPGDRQAPDRGARPNLAYLSLVEVLYGYPLDGVVLTTGCDKTTRPASMAAATVNIPRSCSRAGRC
jgi:hypothetical protein